MLRKHPRSEMVKASLWMHRDEYRKLIDLSGDLSINAYVMSNVRKEIAAAEASQSQS